MTLAFAASHVSLNQNYLNQMKVIFKSLLALSLVACLLTFSACVDDPEPDPGPDFGIYTSTSFIVEETHDNGWVKYARQLFFDGSTRSEFEYYENGYIKTAIVYSDYPEYHKYMEVSRDIENRPISSTYYNEDGSINASFEYENGLLTQKTVNSDNGSAVTLFENGQISSIKYTTEDQAMTTDIVYTNNAREITISNSEEVAYNGLSPIETALGEGAHSFSNLALVNPFAGQSFSVSNVLSSSSSSIKWENTLKPTDFVPVARLYKSFQNEYQPFHTDFAINTDTYREIIEQFPVAEDQILIGGYQSVKDQLSLQISFEARENIKNEREADINVFTQKYGNEYNNTSYRGKYLFMVGVLRNLPSDETLRDQIKDIAYNKAYDLTSGTSTVSEADQELLDRVFFELRIFTSAMDDLRGKTIASFEDYESVVQELESSESEIVQRQYQSYDYL